MRKASTGMPEQGTQTPSPAPDLIPAKHQPRTYTEIGTANGGTSTLRRIEKALDLIDSLAGVIVTDLNESSRVLRSE